MVGSQLPKGEFFVVQNFNFSNNLNTNNSYEWIKKGLDVSAIRQKTISSNISNLNTPNYKVNRVEFEKHLTNATDKISLNKTHQMHFGLDSLEATVEKRETTFLNDNGNNVDVDFEMTELAANEIYYNVLVSQINAKLSNLNYVINR